MSVASVMLMAHKGKFIFSFLLLYSYFVGTSSTSILANISKEIIDNPILDRWMNLDQSMKENMKSFLNGALSHLLYANEVLNLTSQCQRESLQLISGLKNLDTWAIRFLDSSAKPQSGFISGAVSSFGAYKQCLDTVATEKPYKENSKALFQGQYCLIDVKPPLPNKTRIIGLNDHLEELRNFSGSEFLTTVTKMAHYFHLIPSRLGVCIPSGCSRRDMDQLAKLTGDHMYLSAKISTCEVHEKVQYTETVIFVICVCSFLILLVLFSSLVEVLSYSHKMNLQHKGFQVLLAFSLLNNFKKLFYMKTSSESLLCLHGIRALSMFWVVLGHTYIFHSRSVFMFENTLDFKTSMSTFLSQTIVNGALVVDTFFFLGGFLTCYLFTKLVIQKKHPFSIPIYLLHRLWRILPGYAFIIMITMLIPLAGSGPIFKESVRNIVLPCQYLWWLNLLFLNNFSDIMCLPHTWYIACDVQLHVAAILVLLSLKRWPKIGISIGGGLILASAFYTGIMTYLKDLPPTMLLTTYDLEELVYYWRYIYSKPFTHAAPYLIGILTGYLLAVKAEIKIPGKGQVIGWCLAITFSLTALYGTTEWNKGSPSTVVEKIAYAGFHRIAWTTGIAWMIISCFTGSGGLVNYILSWKVWMPLGRLSFLVYLIHPLVQQSFIAVAESTKRFSHYNLVYEFFAHLCISYLIAFLCAMFVEYPIISLEKIIFSERFKKLENTSLDFKNSVCSDETKDIFKSPIFTIMGSKLAETKLQNAVVAKSFTSTGDRNTEIKTSESFDF